MKQFFLQFIFYFLIRHKLTNIRFDMGSLLRDCPINFDNKHSYVVVNVYNHKHIKLFLLSQTRHKLQVNKCITRFTLCQILQTIHKSSECDSYKHSGCVCMRLSLCIHFTHLERTITYMVSSIEQKIQENYC